jgi:hypothetical protein
MIREVHGLAIAWYDEDCMVRRLHVMVSATAWC